MKSSQTQNPAPRLGPKTIQNHKNELKKKKSLKKEGSGENQQRRQSTTEKSVSSQQLSKQQTSKSIENNIKSELQFIFQSSKSDQYSKSYHTDGDPSMYTAEAIREREQLKNDVEVKKQVYNFMKHYRFDENGQLTKDEYFTIHLQLANLLRDDLSSDYKQGELSFILEQDWKHDSKGKEKMSRDDLFNSLFELVDIWTPTSRKQEYLDFFSVVSEKLVPNTYNYNLTQAEVM